LLTILQSLEKIKPEGESALAQVWHEIADRHLKRRGMVILLSDCFDDVNSLGHALHHLRYRNHEILLFQILAPEENNFPFSGPTRFRDLEMPSRVITSDARRLREEYLKNFEEYRQSLKRKLSDLHIDSILLRTDEPVDRALGAYLARRTMR
jgi:uncharacterized protein (DUF58 family)